VNRVGFLREIQLAASLQHPHIVPLLSAGYEDDSPTTRCLIKVMLRARLGRAGNYRWQRGLGARDVLDALTYAHAHGISIGHQTDNVLVQAITALVADFGVAKAISEAAGRRVSPRPRGAGHTGYMASRNRSRPIPNRSPV